MEFLSERLEIRLRPETLHHLREEARQRNLSIAQLVRQAIEAFLEEDRQSRLEAARALFQIGARVSNWEEMKREIEESVLKEPSLATRLEQLAQEDARTADQVLETVMQDYLDRLEKELIHIETEHFWNMHDDLAARYPGEHVAIVKGVVIDHDVDVTKLAIRIRRQYDTQPVLIAPVRAGLRRDLVWRGGPLENRQVIA